MTQLFEISNIDAFVFDFDGVLTDNLVYLDQNGKESVRCSRSDGLAFELLKKINKPVYILSTEKNSVVTSRAKKLKIPVLQGISNKVEGINKIVLDNGFDLNKILYIGNDVNDYRVMKLCGLSACPADSHQEIKKIATVVLKKNGGNGVIRELLEDLLELNFI
jgi:YrbI family 3-deoxy-D-manno-octulosonate 8-phosphate phosphatase